MTRFLCFLATIVNHIVVLSSLYFTSQCERKLSESSNSLKWSKERVHELEMRVNSLEEVIFHLYGFLYSVYFCVHYAI